MRSDNLVPLTPDEHRELGKEMTAAASRLREFCGLVLGVYGPQSRVGFSFVKAMEAVDHLNREMQTQAIQDSRGSVTHQLYE
jgi:hypothetical protein